MAFDEDEDDFDLKGELETGLVIGDSRGGGYSIALEGRRIESAPSLEDAVGKAYKIMEDGKYWPNVFYVNERGNVDLLVIKALKKKGKVVGVTYEVARSWV